MPTRSILTIFLLAVLLPVFGFVKDKRIRAHSISALLLLAVLLPVFGFVKDKRIRARSILALLLLAVLLPVFGFSEVAWNERKGNHFFLYEQEGGSFSDEVLRRAEDIYSDTIRYFGSLSSQGFWTWEQRCKIYLYDSRNQYLTETRQPEWSSGFADIRRRAIVSYQNAPDFLDSVLPHEMGHLILREFIEVDNRQVPRWLDEGFAIAQEAHMRVALDDAVKRAVRSNAAIPISDLNKIGGLQNRPAEQAKLFYAQAQSLTRFLLQNRDSSHFINFCRLLRDGVSLGDALRRSYREFENLEEFEKEWKRYVLQS